MNWLLKNWLTQWYHRLQWNKSKRMIILWIPHHTMHAKCHSSFSKNSIFMPCNSFASSCWEGQRQLVKYISEAQMYSITMPLYKRSILTNLNLKPHFPLQRCHAVGVRMSDHKHLVQVRTSLNGRFSYAIWKKHHPSWSCVKTSELGIFNLHIEYWHAFDALNYVQKNLNGTFLLKKQITLCANIIIPCLKRHHIPIVWKHWPQCVLHALTVLRQRWQQ
jgi:hypothetical protein